LFSFLLRFYYFNIFSFKLMQVSQTHKNAKQKSTLCGFLFILQFWLLAKVQYVKVLSFFVFSNFSQFFLKKTPQKQGLRH